MSLLEEVRELIIAYEKLERENTELRKGLEFYADRSSWEWSRHPTHEMYSGEIKNDESLIFYREKDGETYNNYCGGKLAREILASLDKGEK